MSRPGERDARFQPEDGMGSDAILDSIMDHSPTGMALVTLGGRCLRVNRALCEMLGYTRDELIALTSLDITHPDDVIASQRAYRLLNEGQNENHYAEKRYRCKDGRYFWGYVTWSIVRDSSGRPGNIVVQVVDISDHKRHEQDLEELTRYLELAIQASRLGIWSYNFDTRAFDADARTRELWGHENPADSPLLRDDWLLKIHPDDRANVVQRYESAIRNECEFETEHRVMLRDGRVRYLGVQSVIQRHADGRPQKIIGVNADLTDRMEVARHLKQAKDEAEAANRAKSMFLANMSHELRTPLNAIIGFSDAMKSGIINVTNSDTVRSYSADIYASGQHLLGIINDLLDLSRIEAGKFLIEETVFNLVDVFNDAGSLIRSSATEAGITLDYDFSTDVPSLRGDERAIRQIMINLLSNAVKFTPQGGRVTCGLGRAPGGDIRFWVSDTGIGIAEKDIPRLMQPFAQIDNVYRRQYQGAGLGLAIVRSLAELHGGGVSIVSPPGSGTTVTVTLPATRMIVAVEPQFSPAATAASSPRPYSPSPSAYPS